MSGLDTTRQARLASSSMSMSTPFVTPHLRVDHRPIHTSTHTDPLTYCRSAFYCPIPRGLERALSSPAPHDTSSSLCTVAARPLCMSARTQHTTQTIITHTTQAPTKSTLCVPKLSRYRSEQERASILCFTCQPYCPKYLRV